MRTDRSRIPGYFDRGLALALAAYCALAVAGLGALCADILPLREKPMLVVLFVGIPLIGLTTVLILQGTLRPRPFEWGGIAAAAVLLAAVAIIAAFSLVAVHID